MPPNGSFKSQSFNPFSVNEDLKDNKQDPMLISTKHSGFFPRYKLLYSERG